MNFAFTADGDRLVVRVDTFTGARFARTVLVPDDAISVTIVRTETSLRPNVEPRSIVRTVTDARAITSLVKLVDGLPGAMTTEIVTSCPASLEERSYRLTFATPNSAYVAWLPTTMCWPSVSLRHNGTKAGPPLDPGRHFTKVVDRYLS
ncbi:MAG: hypothetical protein JF565_09490 [Propionibacteriales bacterium]|nr:hypothetical protein [Propionibacteriales bacterium]